MGAIESGVWVTYTLQQLVEVKYILKMSKNLNEIKKQYLNQQKFIE